MGKFRLFILVWVDDLVVAEIAFLWKLLLVRGEKEAWCLVVDPMKVVEKALQEVKMQSPSTSSRGRTCIEPRVRCTDSAVKDLILKIVWLEVVNFFWCLMRWLLIVDRFGGLCGADCSNTSKTWVFSRSFWRWETGQYFEIQSSHGQNVRFRHKQNYELRFSCTSILLSFFFLFCPYPNNRSSWTLCRNKPQSHNVGE